MIIRVLAETLTDGSVAHDVRVSGRTFHAYSEIDALKFADAIADAINTHTTETAHVSLNGEHVP